MERLPAPSFTMYQHLQQAGKALDGCCLPARAVLPAPFPSLSLLRCCSWPQKVVPRWLQPLADCCPLGLPGLYCLPGRTDLASGSPCCSEQVGAAPSPWLGRAGQDRCQSRTRHSSPPSPYPNFTEPQAGTQCHHGNPHPCTRPIVSPVVITTN